MAGTSPAMTIPGKRPAPHLGSRAISSAARLAPNAPIDKITVQFKGAAPTVTIFTGKPTGGEDRKLDVGMTQQQTHQLGAGVTRSPKHADFRFG